MATLVLGLAGSALGGVFGPIGALVGRAVGALAGSLVDSAIISAFAPPIRQEGPRLTTTDIQTSTEGSVINRMYGRARLVGQVMWATRYQEEVHTETTGGKGGGPKVKTTTYTYFANFAIGLCEGPISGVGRIWADGKELDQSLYTFRVYRGTEDQDVDPLIEAKEGTAPAYRGLCYVVFELMDLTDFGNRIPQMSVEVYRAVGALEGMVDGVAIIAGNEFGFDTQFVKQSESVAENRHTLVATTDWTASLDRLAQLAPNCQSAMLVCPWFGDDLRVGNCTIRPKVDAADKQTKPIEWRVGSVTRDTALVVSYIDGKPAYGGSPNDASVLRAIADLQARGYSVTLLPFIMMDVPGDNALPDPYGGASQSAYPWRGRITCDPAPGRPGTPDKSAPAASQVAAFVGTADPGDFSLSGGNIVYSGPAEWSYRRFVLHYAKLAAQAGGVEAFLIGSEMVGLTTVRSAAGTYPFVTALKDLAADVSSILGGSVKVGYAADWSEYNSHRPGDGSGDLYFHLDPLWSDANIDFIGIDNYFPLSDWRQGSGHLDFDPDGATTPYDPAYLAGNVEGGEYFDWYYADKAGRDAQDRLPITDGAYGKPWVYRQKDIRNFWANAHYNRPGGTESGSPTAWVAQSKPVRFIELGCPATDKGSNQPNVFPDPKSSESAYPWYSTRGRDDVASRSWIQAMLTYYGSASHNPNSTAYGGRMIDLARSHVWAWDARPWPTFPLDNDWGDAPNWETGHWINGRLGLAPAQETIQQILADAGFTDAFVEPIPAVVDGVTVGNIVSARSLLDSLRPCYQFDAVESDGLIKFLARIGRPVIASVALDNLVIADADNPTRYRRTRAQETELPDTIKLRYADIARDDQQAGVEARRAAGGSLRTVDYSVPAVMPENFARRICDIELYAAWVGREKAEFSLPPSRLALDAGDVVAFGPMASLMRFSEITDSEFRRISAFAVDPLSHAGTSTLNSAGPTKPSIPLMDARAVFVDGPLLADGDFDHAPYVAGFMSPYRSGVAAYRSPTTSGYVLDTLLPVRATMGVTTADLYSGPSGRWDRVTSVYIGLLAGTLQSVPDLHVLNGSNALLVENQDGEWELLQFATATPNGANNYILTDLLRGQKGTEHAMRDPVPAGARAVLVNSAILQSGIEPAHVGVLLNWRIGPADRDIGSTDYSTVAMTLHGKGRRPLSPVHLRTNWESDGDIALTWIRRTRIGGDSWDVAEVPLGEAAELYEVEILSFDGSSVVRTITGLGAPAWQYPVALQVEDFGSSATSLRWRVYQVSATFGRGIPAEYP